MEQAMTASSASAALAAFAAAAIVAAGLSARGGPTRLIGLVVAALASLFGAAALGQAEAAGVFAAFKKPATPLDPLKPLLLTFDMVAAVGLGVLFVILAVRGRRDPGPVAVGMANGPTRYGSVSRFLHWSIAALILALVPLGLYMAGLPEGDPSREWLYDVHKSLGLTVLLLALARILWDFVSKLPPLSPDLSRANRIGAKAAHYTLYLLMLGFPVTGYFMSTYFGAPTHWFFIEVPRLVAENKPAALPFGGLHKIALPVLLYIVVTLHIAGAIKHRWFDGQRDALRRMTG